MHYEGMEEDKRLVSVTPSKPVDYLSEHGILLLYT